MSVKLFRPISCLLAILLGCCWLMSGSSHARELTSLSSANRAGLHDQATGLASFNWAGYIADGAVGTFKAASFTFTVPTLQGQQGDHAAAWVGLGGGLTPSPRLVQAGVDSWIDDTGHQINAPFWEVVPGFTEQIVALNTNIQAGDQISVSVGSVGKDIFLINDLSTGSSASFVVRGATHLTDGASAECIVERPSVDRSLIPLAEFRAFAISRCLVGASATRVTALSNWSHRSLNIVNTSGQVLASAGPLSHGSGFSVFWDGRA